MYPSRLGRLIAILATMAGFSAFAGSAYAQIPASTGGDVVDHDPLRLDFARSASDGVGAPSSPGRMVADAVPMHRVHGVERVALSLVVHSESRGP